MASLCYQASSQPGKLELLVFGRWVFIIVVQLLLSKYSCVSERELHSSLLWVFIQGSNNNIQIGGLFNGVPSTDLSWTFFLQDSQPETEVPLKTVVTPLWTLPRSQSLLRGQPRMDWNIHLTSFFPFKMAFSRGEGSQKGLHLCHYYPVSLTAWSSQPRDWVKKGEESDFSFPHGKFLKKACFWLNRSSPYSWPEAFRKTEDLSEGVEIKLGHMATLCLIYWETATLLSRVAVPPAVYEGSSFSTSFAIVFILAILDNGCKWSHCDLPYLFKL